MKHKTIIHTAKMPNPLRFIINKPFKASFGATLVSGAIYGGYNGINMAEQFCFQKVDASMLETLSDCVCYGLIVKGNIMTYTAFAGITYMCLPFIFPIVFNKYMKVNMIHSCDKTQEDHIIIHSN